MSTELELFMEPPTEAMMDETEDRLAKGRARRCIPAERTDDDIVFAALRKEASDLRSRLVRAVEAVKMVDEGMHWNDDYERGVVNGWWYHETDTAAVHAALAAVLAENGEGTAAPAPSPSPAPEAKGTP